MTAATGLGEGNTPLVRSVDGSRNVWFKLESCNPSGSYKDRFIAREAALLVERRARACVATSSGNTGSALAAYCARYGLRCLILVNHDAPAGKLAQMQAHGALVLRIADFVHDARVTAQVFETLRAFSQRENVPLVVSAFRYCPVGMSGVEGIAAELLAQTAGRPLDHVFVPVGGGGLYAAVVQGFQKSVVQMMPKVHVVQPARCSTVAAAFVRGDDEIRPVPGSTRISGLAVPYDIDASLALRRLRECGGTAFEVGDEEVFEAQQLMLSREGIYCEPAGAAALAGWMQARLRGVVDEAELSVCLVTGHGFKDPASVELAAQRHPSIPLQPGDVEAALPRLLQGGGW